MASLEGLDLPIVVISNQACVEKRLVSPGDLEDITRRFVQEFRESGVQIDAVYYCPHTSEQGCNCRKPRSGLIEAAALEWKIDLTRSVFIGDSASDLQAARALHCPSVFVRPENGASNAGIAEKQSLSALTVKQTSEIPGAVSRLLQALPG
jgi:D-glycero-D-manno-heptose 1,7-bisphosphate phosphatase